MRFGYVLAFLFIAGWWSWAFMPKASLHTVPSAHYDPASLTATAQPALSPLVREDISRALSGDFDLISRLLIEWDMDAQLLQFRGLEGIERLSTERLLTALDLVYRLQQNNRDEIASLRSFYRKSSVIDDASVVFPCQKQTPKVIPHTIASASFVLALNGTDNVVAIPKAIRNWQSFFPLQSMQEIPYDCDRVLGEVLSAAHPDIAFVASYSNPASIEALRRQGVDIFTLSDLNTKDEITSAIERIGEAINRSLEAQILCAFIDAAFLCIDNRVAAMRNDFQPFVKPLVTYYYGQWYFPTYKTLTSRLAERAGIPYPQENLFDHPHSIMWLQPVSNEQIVFYNPSQLIIAADKRAPLHVHTLVNQPFFSEIDACRNSNIQIIDAEIQQSVSQHIVLAYFDLYHALIRLAKPCPPKLNTLTSALAY
ncbi:MAG: ABC transporter substrate-binding protein [Parachlamydiales bacterium]|jgi:ABC-type Fe3+-hydroxamate transport system substrate-binding protein